MSEFTLPFGLDEALATAEWQRDILRIYDEIRGARGEPSAWDKWRSIRDGLMADHRKSPLTPDRLEDFKGLSYFDYGTDFRVLGTINEVAPSTVTPGTADKSSLPITRLAMVTFNLRGRSHSLDLFWMGTWRGGFFLPFTDGTNGRTTYAGGRYLIDMLKGEDLGVEGDQLVLDFNFAYHPPCAHNPSYSCPLPGPGSQIDAEVRAGERLPAHQ
jgi:uncharacterized protein (DUF1684 family)